MRRRTDDGPNGGHKGTQKNLLEFGLLVCITREGSELRSVGKFPRIIVQCDCRGQGKRPELHGLQHQAASKACNGRWEPKQ